MRSLRCYQISKLTVDVGGDSSDAGAMRTSKTLVRFILENANNYKWSLQGFGMLRLYLSPTTRLHVWDDTFRVPGVSDIHDHPWDFESEIVAGELRNYRFDVEVAVNGGYHMSKLRCGPGGGLVGEPETVRLIQASDWFLRHGGAYCQRHDEVHKTVPANGTVTIVERDFREDVDHARVFWPRGEEWVSAEPRDATPEEIGAITKLSLARWFS